MIQSNEVEELSIVTENIEINTVRIKTNSISFLLCTIYRPNNKHFAVEEFSQTLQNHLQDIATKNKILLI